MFTGLIREVGQITKITPALNGKKLFIKASLLTAKASIGDSISVNGVCLTVEKIESQSFQFHVISTSLDK